MGPSFGPVVQLGYAVRDIDAWMRNFVAAGVGPWWLNEDVRPQTFRYRGVETPARFACGISWSGPLMIEVIAPLDEHPSPYRDFVASGREGLQHVCYFPDDAEAARAELVSQGFAQIVDGRSGGFHFTYYERPGAGLDAIEIGDIDAATRDRFAALQAECAAWDGSDPIR